MRNQCGTIQADFQEPVVRLPRSGPWGRSSAGRASRSQCEGREFDPPRLHHCSKGRTRSGFFMGTGPSAAAGLLESSAGRPLHGSRPRLDRAVVDPSAVRKTPAGQPARHPRFSISIPACPACPARTIPLPTLLRGRPTAPARPGSTLPRPGCSPASACAPSPTSRSTCPCAMTTRPGCRPSPRRRGYSAAVRSWWSASCATPRSSSSPAVRWSSRSTTAPANSRCASSTSTPASSARSSRVRASGPWARSAVDSSARK